ncbi:MAG: hypothetical protein FJ388_10930 [Verrucomicrobia bacterium]|nr:hypothetical protein [Verrucomicrobiota bacterium]
MKIRETIGKTMITLFACIGLFVSGVALLSIVDQLWVYPDRRPGDDIVTLEDFLARRQPTSEVLKALVNGCTYYMVKESWPVMFVIPTQSASVFDSHGNLIAWKPNIGDPGVGIILHFVRAKPQKVTLSQVMNEIKLQRESSSNKRDDSVRTEGSPDGPRRERKR